MARIYALSPRGPEPATKFRYNDNDYRIKTIYPMDNATGVTVEMMSNTTAPTLQPGVCQWRG